MSFLKEILFPELNFDNWHSTERNMNHTKDNDNPHDFKICVTIKRLKQL